MKCDFILDTERFQRQGFPEAIYSSGKTEKQVIEIISKLLEKPNPIIAKIVVINPLKTHITHNKNYIAVITAGTSDIPIAEESAVTAESLGNKVERIYDVGVAGIHRLFKFHEKIKNASCVIVCAGMEGALASVVGGLASKVVIGVPTSTGYGTGKGGYSALLTMLNSCSPNVCVVNIDNGFGAGIIANIINKN